MCRFLGFWPGKIKNPKFCATYATYLPRQENFVSLKSRGEKLVRVGISTAACSH